ncbi:hypothetical protein STRDD10_01917 [Streptococcus sp. DD10]|uniref:CPBP family intramembrane glutamic endopeptidase n=1 Tax=Streptococcus sp. DD10 TaxID=1777878 RepID=UPI00079357ED|nr:type II CAAX endopeptidase family protein [Streptococcus sp. DD10]KXT72428.1 hypothetical protein STRDD10_01917 [Streptococcus sp. DD10]
MQKETRFYLGTIAILISYYLIFNGIMDLEVFTTWSDFAYYSLMLVLTALQGFLAVLLLVKSGRWSEYGKFRFRWSYLGILFLSFVLLLIWVSISSILFPHTQNGQALREMNSSLTGVTYILVRFVYGALIAPISEELVHRDLLMTSLSEYKRYGVDIIVSATLFSLMHILQYGWVLTDFIFYFVMGLILCMVFRYTRSVYWSIASHVLWNSFLTLLGVLLLGY